MIFSRRASSFALSIVPLAVFLRVAAHLGGSDAAWFKAFLSGCAVTAAVAGVSVLARVPAGDLLPASALLLFTGALAFLPGAGAVLDIYREYQESVFLAWYLLLRIAAAAYPGAFSGWMCDPYAARPRLAVWLAAAMVAWSFFPEDRLFSVFLPFAVYSAALGFACRRGA